jgi:hypothetical protein
MAQQKPSITWVSSPGRGIGSQMFGLITTFCVARDLEMHFYANWNLPSLKLQPALIRTFPAPKQEQVLINDDTLRFLESKEVEAKWVGKHISIQSVQNLYQHFAYPRPQYDYRNNLLYAIVQCFKYFFEMPKNIPVVDYGNYVGIHVRPNQTQASISTILKNCKTHITTAMPKEKSVFIVCRHNPGVNVLNLAKQVFGAGFTVISNKNDREAAPGELTDLLSLKKCKVLYIPWNSNFARMGALMSPFRDFYVYNQPANPSVHKCDLDELLSYSR